MSENASPPEIAFVGAGGIGAPMAERLLDRNRRLLVCDPAVKPRALFASRGCPVAPGAAAAAGAGTIVFMVADDAQLRAAAATLAEALRPGDAPRILVMSTVLPETARDIAALLAPFGARTLDAPVSGGSIRARDGELSIMAGGDSDLFEELRPLMADLATTIVHCGGLGSGLTVKILNNLVGVTNLFLFSEAMRVAQALGLDLPSLAAIMEQSSGRNAGTRDWEARKKLFAWNSVDLAAAQSVVGVTRKDLRHAVALAGQSGVDTPLLHAVAAAHDATPIEEVLERWRRLAADQGTASP